MEIDRLRRILEMDPNDPLANYALGNKLVMESRAVADHREAIPLLRKAIAGDRNHLAAYWALAHALVSTGDRAAARRIVEDALAILPQVPPGSGADLEPEFRDLLEELA